MERQREPSIRVRRPESIGGADIFSLTGNVGFVSPGVGYAFLGRHLEADAFFGWVPRGGISADTRLGERRVGAYL